MSPRRRVDDGAGTWFRQPDPVVRRRGPRLIGLIATVLILAALATSAVVFAGYQSVRRDAIRDEAVRSSVRTFLTQYTSPDPFNANAYAEKVLALGTGNFATMFSERMNEVVLQVAQAEPGFGTVLEQDVGIERWNEDGSASVIAVASMTTKLPDGTRIDSGSRWQVTAVKEGDQWKVSDLIQVL